MRPPDASTLHVTGRTGRRVDARLHCGFCDKTTDVEWRPGSADQDMTSNLAVLHFSACPARGDVLEVRLYVFDDGNREQITLTLPRPATYIAVDAPARLEHTNGSIEFFADIDGRRVTNRMPQEDVEFLEGDIREPGRRDNKLAIFEKHKAEMHRIAEWKIESGERNETGGANVFLLDRDRFADR